MKMKIGVALLGAVAVVASITLFANGNKPVNSILDTTAAPVFKTAYNNGGGGANAPAVQPVDFEKAASAAVPSVVHIKTLTKFRQTAGGQQSPGQGQQPGEDQDPFGGMFKRFFGDGNGQGMQQSPEQRASGSGVIISQDGYIVTNNHVVNGASEITVTMNNRKNYTAKVIGTDPNTDLALIKIDAKDLPVMDRQRQIEEHRHQYPGQCSRRSIHSNRCRGQSR
jgi:serine protease Do